MSDCRLHVTIRKVHLVNCTELQYVLWHRRQCSDSSSESSRFLNERSQPTKKAKLEMFKKEGAYCRTVCYQTVWGSYKNYSGSRWGTGSDLPIRLLEIMVDNQEKVKCAYPHGSKVTDDCFTRWHSFICIVMLYVHQSYNLIIDTKFYKYGNNKFHLFEWQLTYYKISINTTCKFQRSLSAWEANICIRTI